MCCVSTRYCTAVILLLHMYVYYIYVYYLYSCTDQFLRGVLHFNQVSFNETNGAV